MKAKQPTIILLPGPAGAGRDFLINLIISNADVLHQKYGEPIKMGIAQKITDRPSRGENDALKKCVTTEEFMRGVEAGLIIAPYVLESNGKNYGYEVDAFDKDGFDVLFADASVYQIPALRKQFGPRANIVAMINSRTDRESNMVRRGTEKPEEIVNRLNLGDGHVALLCKMAKVPYQELIHPDLHAHLENGEHEKVTSFTRSESVHKIYRDIDGDGIIDQVWYITDEYRVNDGDDPVKTRFFEKGVEIVIGSLPQLV